MKKLLLIIGTIILICIIIFVFKISYEENSRVCFENNCFKVEIAKTAAERNKGLMFRETLPENEGMLFVFENSEKHAFWMKDTLIPLDMIWINKNFTVVDIKTAKPCKTAICETFVPQGDALYVLEINAELSSIKNISIGNKALFDLST